MSLVSLPALHPKSIKKWSIDWSSTLLTLIWKPRCLSVRQSDHNMCSQSCSALFLLFLANEWPLISAHLPSQDWGSAHSHSNKDQSEHKHTHANQTQAYANRTFSKSWTQSPPPTTMHGHTMVDSWRRLTRLHVRSKNGLVVYFLTHYTVDTWLGSSRWSARNKASQPCEAPHTKCHR